MERNYLSQADRCDMCTGPIFVHLKFKQEKIAEIYNSMCVSSGRNPQIVLTLSNKFSMKMDVS